MNEIVVSNNNVYEYAAGESSAFWHADCRFSFTSVLFDVLGHKIRENPVSHPRRPKNWSTVKCTMIVIMHRHIKRRFAQSHLKPACMLRVQLLSRHNAGGRFLLRVLGFRCYFFLASPLGQPPGICREVTHVLESKDVILPIVSCIPIIYQECVTSLQSKEKKSIGQLRN